MIDIATETIITLEDAAKRLLVNTSSVFRWVTQGTKEFKLEAFRVGKRWRTSVEALQRFANAQTPVQETNSLPTSARQSPAPAVRAPTSEERRRHLAAVTRRLDDALGDRFCAVCDLRIKWLKGSVPKTGRVWCPRCLVKDYTRGALDGYDKEDVAGLLEDRLEKARERLEETREAVKALCEPVAAPKDQTAYFRYFSSAEPGNAAQLKENEPRRLSLYKQVAALVRAYANIAGEMEAAGYTAADAAAVKDEVTHYECVRDEVKLHSGDAIDLKSYEPAMRHLIDTYIRAEGSEKVSEFDDLSLVQLLVERGVAAVEALPPGIRENETSVAETIENNVRKLIIDEHPINPKYYDRMSELLDALIEQRKQNAIAYREYLAQIAELTKQAKCPAGGASYPTSLDTAGKRALFDNLENDEAKALAVDQAVREARQDDWRGNKFKAKKIWLAVKAVLDDDEGLTDRVLELVKNQHEY